MKFLHIHIKMFGAIDMRKTVDKEIAVLENKIEALKVERSKDINDEDLFARVTDEIFSIEDELAGLYNRKALFTIFGVKV